MALSTGWKSSLLGTSGEGLFQHLAYFWDAQFIPTSVAPHIDGYVFWPAMGGVRLPVQIKSVERTNGKSWVDVEIGSHNLRDWAHHHPLLVLCDISEHLAWWVDTAEYSWPWEIDKSRTLRVRLNRSVDVSTRDSVKRIALSRCPHHDIPFVLGRRNRSIADLPPEFALERLKSAYRETTKTGIIERDSTALAVARMICEARSSFRKTKLEQYLELVIDRLVATRPGGLSFTLGALTALLRTRRQLPTHSSFIPHLADAATRAITSRTFITPEFGLLIAAALHDRFPSHPDVSGLVEHLVLRVDQPQNSTVALVANRINRIGYASGRPLSSYFSDIWLAEQIKRPLYRDADIFLDRAEADAAAARAVKAGVASADPKDLDLADQLIRLKASILLDDWITHS